MAQQLGVSHHKTGNAPLLLTGESSVSKDFMDSLALGWHKLYQFGKAPSDPTTSTTSSDVAVASATSNVSPLTSGSSLLSTIQTDNALWSVSAQSPSNALRQHKRSRTETHQTAPVVDVEGIGMDAVSTTKKRRYTTNSTGLNYLPQALYVQSTTEGRLRSGSMGTKRRLEQ
ncbi:hypothetical protein IE81DRAFT_235791 [Ceraceosorus guamensis]|uniref:Uncharacterized protein n=1 Tax=Ceraceosorus guamensis TaxID=1522189 RepID=A0A316VT67_9BASI|nr:hypothetical protein IE81DRAFT_235791 [Ceraceosorus guamensis]PWN40228.1 hypothetical protein IE81DRAFT_235791 [Ceraceosorus guamensis]